MSLFFFSLLFLLSLLFFLLQDLDLLTDEFDADGDGQITYEEFIAKVMPPEITHGGGGIMDFPCDDPAGKGTQLEQLNKLRKDIKKKISTNSKNMRTAFRKISNGGKVDQYAFQTCLRNLNCGVGQPKLVQKLFHEIDDDNSGHLTFAEFIAGIEHPKDATHGIKIERGIPMDYLRMLTPEGGDRDAANPQDDPRLEQEEIKSTSSSAARSEKMGKPLKQAISREAHQRLLNHIDQDRYRWQRPGARPVPVVFARPAVKRTTLAQQRAADLRRSQGRHPIRMMRAASMRSSSGARNSSSSRPSSAHVANRPSTSMKSRGGGGRKKRPSSGRRLVGGRSKSPRAATIQAAAARAGGARSLHKSNFFRSAPVNNRRYGGATAGRARLQEQLQERVSYTSGRGLVATGDKRLDLSRMLGIKN